MASNTTEDRSQFASDTSDAALPLSEKRQSRFAINTLKYPSDLGAPDLKHYVQFQINVRGKSTLVPESKRLFEVTRDPRGGTLTKDQLGSKALRGATALAAGAGAYTAGKAISTAIASKAAKGLNLSGAVSQKITKAAGTVVGGVAAGAAAGGLLATDLLKPDQTFRISDAISLYVSEPPTVRYAMQYSNKELGTLTGVLSGSTFDTQNGVSGTAETMAAFGASVAKLPGAFGAADVGSALSASSGTALNPFKEVIFEAVDFRSFAFKYKFLPKSAEEAREVKRIINLFKFHMHPEISDGKLFFIYPSEFQITYYFNNSENEYMHQFRPCVLESMDVTYGGEQFSTFKDGTPTEVNISLIFRETEIITRNMVGEDGAY